MHNWIRKVAGLGAQIALQHNRQAKNRYDRQLEAVQGGGPSLDNCCTDTLQYSHCVIKPRTRETVQPLVMLPRLWGQASLQGIQHRKRALEPVMQIPALSVTKRQES